MAVFSFPAGTINHRGALLVMVGDDNTITIEKFPVDTSFTANTLKSAPDPTQVYQAMDIDGATTVVNQELHNITGV